MPDPLAVVLPALVAAVGGFLAPRVIARLPEPVVEQEPTESDGPTGPEKIPYAVLAARPHLGLVLGVASAVLAGSVGWRSGLALPLVGWVVFAVLGVTLAYVDWFTHLLPKRLVLPAYPVVLLTAGLTAWSCGETGVLVRVAVGWLAVSGVYVLLWLVAPRGLGYGDVRFSGVVAIVLATFGWSELLVGAYGGFLLGAVGGLALVALRLADRRAFPFGPFMVLGAWVGALAGPAIAGAWA